MPFRSVRASVSASSSPISARLPRKGLLKRTPSSSEKPMTSIAKGRCWPPNCSTTARPSTTPRMPSKAPALGTESRWDPMRRRGQLAVRPGQTPRRLPMASTRTVMPAASIQLFKSACTSCIGGERKRRVVSPATSVQLASWRQRAMMQLACVFVLFIVAYFEGSGLSANTCFDVAVRLVGGNEDLVRIVLAEAREIDEKAVFVRHDELDLINLRCIFERALGHGVERLLDGFAFVVGKGSKQRLTDGCADGVEVKIVGGVPPLRANGGAEEAIPCLRQCGERVLDVAFEAGVCGLEQNEVVEAGEDVECASLCAFDAGGLAFAAASHEGAGVWLAVDGEALPQSAFDADGGGFDLLVSLEQEVGKLLRVVLHRGCRGGACDGVDRVLHRVGRKNFAVVAIEMGRVKVPFEQHLDGPLAQVIAILVARDLHQADAGFSVTIFSKFNHRVSFLDRWCSRWP